MGLQRRNESKWLCPWQQAGGYERTKGNSLRQKETAPPHGDVATIRFIPTCFISLFQYNECMSRVDEIFIENCKQILAHGYDNTGETVRPRWEDGTPAYTKKLFGLVNRYDLQVEFPASTIRPVPLKNAIDEVLWIWQKKSNRLSELKSKVWDQWALPDGTIGKAYGYQLGIKHQYADGEFDQVDRILFDLKHNPESRRILASMYTFADLHDMALYPCAYSLTLNVTGNVLNAILNQRSQDMLAASFWNVAQYAALVHMFAQVSDLVAGEFIHVVADSHIYDRHIPIIEQLIARPSYKAPTLLINRDIKNFYAFTPDDFRLENYEHGAPIGRIEMAV